MSSQTDLSPAEVVSFKAASDVTATEVVAATEIATSVAGIKDPALALLLGLLRCLLVASGMGGSEHEAG